MKVEIRRATHRDIDACARINYEAFKGISDRHQFPTDYPTLDFCTEITDVLINNPWCFDIVAESEGAVVACGFMDEQNPIRGIGPVSVVGVSRGVAIALFSPKEQDEKSWKPYWNREKRLLVFVWFKNLLIWRRCLCTFPWVLR
jgi:hypothetical protein